MDAIKNTSYGEHSRFHWFGYSIAQIQRKWKKKHERSIFKVVKDDMRIPSRCPAVVGVGEGDEVQELQVV